MERRWTASNILSGVRLLLAVPTGITLWMDFRWATFALCLLAALTDVLDGELARRRNEISEFGKVIDPLADKVFVATMVVILLLKGTLPIWFAGVVLGRDLVILLGGLYIERRTGKVLPSNYPGKIAVVSLSLTLLMLVMGVTGTLIDTLMGISLLLLGVSFVLYLVRGTRIIITNY